MVAGRKNIRQEDEIGLVLLTGWQYKAVEICVRHTDVFRLPAVVLQPRQSIRQSQCSISMSCRLGQEPHLATSTHGAHFAISVGSACEALVDFGAKRRLVGLAVETKSTRDIEWHDDTVAFLQDGSA